MVSIRKILTSRTWEPLPDFSEVRAHHGCSYMAMNNTNFLIVYGGNDFWNKGFDDILFLDLNKRNLGWYKVPGIKLSRVQETIMGGVVKQLTPTSCNLMFLQYSRGLYSCSGNYNWTLTPITAWPTTQWKKSVAVGVNPFPPCT